MKYIILWFTAAVVAVFSGLASVSIAAQSDAPELALSTRVKNGLATESLAIQLIKLELLKNGGQMPTVVKPRWHALAVDAFLSEPTASGAVAIIALAQAGEQQQSLMLKAFELSRREQLVNGWLIASGSTGNDISSVLKYYDVVLRTSSTAPDVIVPIMVKALANDSAIGPYATMLSEDPPWAGRFWGEIPSSPESLDNAVLLRQALLRQKVQSDNYQDANLILALTNRFKFEQATQLYQQLKRKKWQTDVVRNDNFRTVSEFPPLDWQLFSTGEYGASIQAGQLNLSAIDNSGGLFARQLVELERRNLILKFVLEQIPVPGDKVSIQLLCAEENVISSSALPVAITELETRIVIANENDACRYYWLDITGRAGEDGDGFAIGFKSVSLSAR